MCGLTGVQSCDLFVLALGDIVLGLHRGDSAAGFARHV